jgi:hypothetical protein
MWLEGLRRDLCTTLKPSYETRATCIFTTFHLMELEHLVGSSTQPNVTKF